MSNCVIDVKINKLQQVITLLHLFENGISRRHIYFVGCNSTYMSIDTYNVCTGQNTTSSFHAMMQVAVFYRGQIGRVCPNLLTMLNSKFSHQRTNLTVSYGNSVFD